MALSEPNPNCMVCGTSQLQLSINTQTTNLGTFVDKVSQRFSNFLVKFQLPVIIVRDFHLISYLTMDDADTNFLNYDTEICLLISLCHTYESNESMSL